MAELRSAIFWVLNCPIYLLRCYIVHFSGLELLAKNLSSWFIFNYRKKHR
ncbi:MAG: hypothetical protein IM597_19225 [Pseudanabaena sp. M176S2SP2A07QC]|nr:hypothetical protein [Pseudanabaena sp. M179S2SP2A07QC]MCA6536224.1 hypothetical protein [Pseudanabaena sp. M176S2SP2A07QC]MCA6538745.1 hypothetical protein [Pseudanabaena sp. M037S2SP2A07QC]MCA6565471.1 hypothetical protein [Pseudanabaena sp. M151S2SP2A07QC]MCA6579844.1 hypothetical protein [Pseudanabaena sp. M085S1SP2A07QC]